MNEAHEREAAIFDAAIELPPDQRAAHLDQACNGDAALRRRLEILLKASESVCALVDSPPDPTMAGTAGLPPLSLEKAGDWIGRYKLLQRIGEGGCGVVYMAEQEEPVRRRVALKIIKLGMDTKSVIARFEAERQALAMMDHPNIAKVFDAGATEAGRPYFVMELVRGMKITEYCDEAKLSTRARLDLFIQVCQAIQHAHQKGIIHRDIKPSNILVTVNDCVAVPKVIDFGIAKATSGQRLTDKTLFTAFEQFIGTPAYMSPEQAMLTSLDIDTRSDIYALGVLLYELLTGQTPFDAKDLLEAGLDEMRRTIREQEPQRPSTRLSTLPGQELSTTAQSRGLDAPRLVSELRGDLDWIVMKSLEKDRARRYETANGLAADIQRHLNNEPVVACPPSSLYRLRKTVQRNKLAFAAGSAVLASLAFGLTLSTILFFRERTARERADEQVATTRAMNTFLLHDLLGQVSADAQRRKGFRPNPNLTVREALERAADLSEDRYKNRPRQEAVVRFHIGESFRSLGLAARGIPHLQRALNLYKSSVGPDDPLTLSTMSSLASAYQAVGQYDLSVPLFEQTLKLMLARLGPDDRSTLLVMANLAGAYQAVGQLDRAQTFAKETLKWRQARQGPNDRDTLGAMNNLAAIYRTAGKLDEARQLLDDTLERMKAHLQPGDPWLLNAMANLGLCHRAARDFDRALPLLETTLKLRIQYQGPDDPQTLGAMSNLADTYQDAGRLDGAIQVLEAKVETLKSRRGIGSEKTLDAKHDLAICYRDAGQLEQARLLFEETLQSKRERLGPDNLDTLEEMSSLAETFAMEKKHGEAEALYREALPHLRTASTHGPSQENPLLGFMLHHLADCLRERGRFDEARPFAVEAVGAYERHDDWPIRERQHAFTVLEAILKALGNSGDLEPIRLKHMEALRAAADKDDFAALNNLAWILATSKDAAVRNGRTAVGFADRAAAKSGRKDPGCLDTLAAAYAEAGEFSKASDAQREAIGLTRNADEKDRFSARLRLYESRIPYREP